LRLALIGVDWGTTSFRAMKLDGDGEILDRVETDDGITSVRSGEFAGVLESRIGGWMHDAPLTPVVMSGMIGSAHGWVDAGYLQCPAALRTLRGHLVKAPQKGVYVIPGLKLAGDRRRAPDVMRGEETQLLGLDEPDGLVCLPGTHSKWVWLTRGVVQRFTTAITGEVYQVLRNHSLLGRLMTGDDHHAGAFERGVTASGRSGGLLQHLFSVRTLPLLGNMPQAAAGSYLSGLLIGHEVRASGKHETVRIVGAPALAERYRDALELVGRKASIVDGMAASGRGLARMMR